MSNFSQSRSDRDLKLEYAAKCKGTTANPEKLMELAPILPKIY